MLNNKKEAKKWVFFTLLVSVVTLTFWAVFRNTSESTPLSPHPEPAPTSKFERENQIDSTTPVKQGELIFDSAVYGEDIDISGWVTYRNEMYGYEVSYPKTWQVVGRGDSANDLSIENTDRERINVFFRKKPYEINLDTWLTSENGPFGGNRENLYGLTKIKIDNYDGFVNIDKGYFFLLIGKGVLTINYRTHEGPGSKPGLNKENFNKIIESIKILF